MALRAVVDHPKFADLVVRLGIPRFMALGCLESLWHFASRFTPQGNIGKYTDAQIEAWIGWNGAPGLLVSGLVNSGWLDRNDDHRLLVHDWHEHADKATKQSLRNKKLSFIGTVGTHKQTWEPQTSETSNECAPTAISCAPPVPVPVPEPVPGAVPLGAQDAPPPYSDNEEANIPDDLPAAPLGNFILERLGIPHSYGLSVKFADAAGFIARDEQCRRGEGARRLLHRARESPPDDGKWQFWLLDQRWKQRESQGVSIEGLE